MALALANALSAEMQVCSRSGGISTRLIFSRDLLTSEPATEETGESDGLFIRFEPDEQIFGQFALYFERLAIVARGGALVRRIPVDLLDQKRDLRFTFDPFAHCEGGTV
jgi:DNA gyrase/topoisomerase IV subunit B